MERRNFKRHDAKAAVEVLVRGGKVRAEITDLSVSGCRVGYRQTWLARGEPVRLRLTDDVEIAGEVAWAANDDVGVRFAQLLAPAIVIGARLPQA